MSSSNPIVKKIIMILSGVIISATIDNDNDDNIDVEIDQIE